MVVITYEEGNHTHDETIYNLQTLDNAGDPVFLHHCVCDVEWDVCHTNCVWVGRGGCALVCVCVCFLIVAAVITGHRRVKVVVVELGFAISSAGFCFLRKHRSHFVWYCI